MISKNKLHLIGKRANSATEKQFFLGFAFAIMEVTFSFTYLSSCYRSSVDEERKKRKQKKQELGAKGEVLKALHQRWKRT